MARMIAEGDFDRLCSYVHDIFSVLWGQMNYSNVRYAFFDFLSIAKSHLEKLDEKSNRGLAVRFDYDNWNALTSIDEAENYICDALEMLLQRSSENGSDYSISIRKSISFIEENYQKNITLQDASAKIIVPCCLSRKQASILLLI